MLIIVSQPLQRVAVSPSLENANREDIVQPFVTPDPTHQQGWDGNTQTGPITQVYLVSNDDPPSRRRDRDNLPAYTSAHPGPADVVSTAPQARMHIKGARSIQPIRLLGGPQRRLRQVQTVLAPGLHDVVGEMTEDDEQRRRSEFFVRRMRLLTKSAEEELIGIR